MNAHAALDRYGTLAEPTTLKIQRRLPGPVERIWDYLTKSDLRRQWLAAGEMPAETGASFELVWRNDELSDVPSQRPEGFGAEHRLESRITELDPPRRLAFTWGSTGGVTIELEPEGADVLLTLTHRRIAERGMRLNIAAGWHAHLDVLADRVSGRAPGPFWDDWAKLKGEYESRIPA